MRLALLLVFFNLVFQQTVRSNTVYTASSQQGWADSVFNTLSLDRKIAQLIFVRANKDNAADPKVADWITRHGIGGIVFFKGSPARQLQLTNEWQNLSAIPLFVAMDAERGLAMRLDSTPGFPYAMTLGACDNDSLVYLMARSIGKGCQRLGIHINFAPVVDINSNPANPVINSRSFGENRDRVLAKGKMYIRGLQKQGVLHTAKHFPGHGDTGTDSHYTLPVVKHTRSLLDSVDLYPFRKLIGEGLEGIMTAHLAVPVLDTTPNAASSLSSLILNDLLRKEYGFNGLIITDALEMGGVTNFYKAGEIEVRALMAGNDVLLMPQDPDKAMAAIRQAVDSCLIWPEEIDEKCLKVLKFKEKYIPQPWTADAVDKLYRDLNPASADSLHRVILQQAFTLLKNDDQLIPLQRPDTLKLASICLGTSTVTDFQRGLERYAPVRHFCLPGNVSPAASDSLLRLLNDFNLVIASWVNTSIFAERQFGLTSSGLAFIDSLLNRKKTILCFFGNPYAFGKMPGVNRANALIAAYQDNPLSYDLSSQAIFGAFLFSGNLPVSVSDTYREGYGLDTKTRDVLRYVIPAEAGIPADDLAAADSLVLSGIEKGAYPGCQVLCALDGKVFYHKTFGAADYTSRQTVNTTDLYDLASLTKVAATTLAIMKLSESGKIDPDDRISHYLPWLRKTNKRNLHLKEIMAHQAGLRAWIPFYESFLHEGEPDTAIFRPVCDSNYCISVSPDMYMHKDYADSIRRMIIESPVEGRGTYRYSDLGFILLKEVVEAVTDTAFEDYLQHHFYGPLGMSTMTFRPLDKFPEERIMPTENDTVFRCTFLRGSVHDQAAALMGGVAGHAGLFSCASDLAILMQMLLNEGSYAGVRYFDPETVKVFTSAPFAGEGNRRGLGFDKPPLLPAVNGPVCESASSYSYGHSGFTGTYIWADPANRMLFVFLSNRIHPDAGNKLLSELNIRTRLHEMFYGLVRKSNPAD